MGVKSTAAGAKRKASGGRAGPAASPKKARIQQDRMDLDSNSDSDSVSDSDMESSSDSEDGGVKLNSTGPKFGGQKANGKPAYKTPTMLKDAEKKKDVKTSREIHAEQRQLMKERKAAKPLADELQRTKKIWERLRRKSHVPAEERKKLIEELYTIITGRMKDFVLKHDAVRAVQTAVKYATVEQKKMIAKELRGAYSQLAESRYAKFLIGKLMVQSDAEVKDMIISEFYGRVRRLINHPEASWILDDIYRVAATKDQKAMLLREWYGPEFALLQSSNASSPPTGDLAKILEEQPAKRGPIMKYLWDMINSLVQKKMTGFTMLHDAMYQYFRNVTVGSEEYNEFFEMVKGDEEGDLLKNMAFTRYGAHLVSLMLANGTAKDRKQLLKTYKDTFSMMSGDPYAHMVILTAYDVIDDTKMTSKAILPELFGESDEQAAESLMAASSNPNARATILYLLEGVSKSVFPGTLQDDLEILNEVHEIRKTTSKKDGDVRTKELVVAMSPQLLKGVAVAAATLVHDSFGCQLVAEIMFSAVGEKTAALEAIAANAAGNPGEANANIDDTASELQPHISRTPHGGRLLKSLIAGGKYDKASGAVKKVDPPLNFANVLYPLIKDHIISWATGPSSFVVVNMLEAEDFEEKKELKSTLKKNTSALEKAAAGNEEPKKKKADKKGQSANGKKKGAAAPPKSGGNQGSKLLLEKLRWRDEEGKGK